MLIAIAGSVVLLLAGVATCVWVTIPSTPDPDTLPPAIFVGLDDLEPFQTAPEVYLTGNEDLFNFGVRVLKRLSDTVYVTVLSLVLMQTFNRCGHERSMLARTRG